MAPVKFPAMFITEILLNHYNPGLSVLEVTQLKYTFLFYRRERKGKRKVPQRYVLKLCDLCGNSALFAVHFTMQKFQMLNS